MGLDELNKSKTFYRGLSLELFKLTLESELLTIKSTGLLQRPYAIMLEVAKEEGILNKNQIRAYKIAAFDATLKNYLK